jgi:hypothetical protein
MGDIVPFKYPKRVLRPKHSDVSVYLEDAPTVLYQYDKIVIVGGPGTGKTYLANKITKKDIERNPQREVWCSDVLHDIEWKDQPSAIAERLKGPAWVAEGVAVLRALRLGLLLPDAVVLRDIPIRPLGDVQKRLWTQCQRWFAEVLQAQKFPVVYRVMPGEIRRRG